MHDKVVTAVCRRNPEGEEVEWEESSDASTPPSSLPSKSYCLTPVDVYTLHIIFFRWEKHQYKE